MKTLVEIYQSIISTSSGGVYIDERNIADLQIEKKIHEGRAMFLSQQYLSRRNYIHPDWVQRFYPEFQQEIQEDECYTKFRCPGFVSFSSKRDGIVFVGSGHTAFTRLTDRGALSNAMAHPISRKIRKPLFIYNNGEIEIWSKGEVKDIMVIGVFADPTDIPTYSKQKDNFQCDPETVAMLEEWVFKTVAGIEYKTPADNVADSATKLQ